MPLATGDITDGDRPTTIPFLLYAFVFTDSRQAKGASAVKRPLDDYYANCVYISFAKFDSNIEKTFKILNDIFTSTFRISFRIFTVLTHYHSLFLSGVM